jgi:membrane-associated phospholipid phosphatase
MKNQLRYLTFALGLALFSTACRDNQDVAPANLKAVKDFDATVVQKWNNLFLLIERNAAGYRPCPAARALGYMGLSAYESCATAMTEHKSIAALYPSLRIPAVEAGKAYQWDLVVHSSYATLFKKFFTNVHPNDMFIIAALETNVEDELRISAPTKEIADRSVAYGRQVAEAVYAFSATDRFSHNMYLAPTDPNYIVPIGAGLWKKTNPTLTVQYPMFPFWGQSRTFAIKEADKTARPPLAYSEDRNSPYYTQMLEVYSTTAPQTIDNKWIAEFWSDDVLGFTFSPSARWIAILHQVIEKEKPNLEIAVLGAAKVGLALNDAAVACWHSKYLYNAERPISYIQKVINPNWSLNGLTTNNFLTTTPPFPAYPSGHSTFGAAAAEALVSIFGSSYKLTDKCHEGRADFVGSAPRTFESFYDMATENAYSRIPLGVHTRQDCEEGLRLGSVCGRRVNQLPFNK